MFIIYDMHDNVVTHQELHHAGRYQLVTGRALAGNTSAIVSLILSLYTYANQGGI
jgi:hypothetical protein